MNPIRIVIVEDDVKISELHRRFADKVEGFTVVGIANTIEQAEDMVDILEPELVLLDLYLPDGRGMDFLWKLRREGIQIDVILITAAKEAHSLQEALRGGAFDYIIKPVIFDRFKASLEKYRTYRSEFARDEVLDQHDIDKFMHHGTSTDDAGDEDVPKGIDPITLKKVKQVFVEHGDEGVSAETVGGYIGASRNTARRYLEYLVATGFLYADIIYGAVGRPERKFFRHS